MKIEESKIKEALNLAYKNAGHKDAYINMYFGNGFMAGVEFVLNELKAKEESDVNIPTSKVN